jgi:hypothetical protein
MKTSTKLGLVLAALFFIVALTASTALAVWGSSQSNSHADSNASRNSGGRMALASETSGNNQALQGRRQRQKARVGALDTAAAELGMSPQDLANELKGGKTLAQVASEKGVDLTTLIDKILEPLQTRLSNAVTNKKITQEQADQRLNDARQNLTDWANNGGPLPGRCDPPGNGSVRNTSPEVPDQNPPNADTI